MQRSGRGARQLCPVFGEGAFARVVDRERLWAEADHEARLREEAQRKRAEQQRVRVWLKDERAMAFGRCRWRWSGRCAVWRCFEKKGSNRRSGDSRRRSDGRCRRRSRSKPTPPLCERSGNGMRSSGFCRRRCGAPAAQSGRVRLVVRVLRVQCQWQRCWTARLLCSAGKFLGNGARERAFTLAHFPPQGASPGGNCGSNKQQHTALVPAPAAFSGHGDLAQWVHRSLVTNNNSTAS